MSLTIHSLLTMPRKKLIVAAAVIGTILIAGIITLLSTKSPSYDFSLNQKVSTSSALRITFPEPIDQRSAERAMELPGSLEIAAKEWEGNTLKLQPKHALEAGKTYVIRFTSSIRTSEGNRLSRALEYTFIATGAPAAVAFVPAPGSADVRPNTDITIVFDRPMVPLTQVQGGTAMARWKDWPVTISPAIKGRWRWLGTTTASFVPEEDLKIETQYTVTVPAGIMATSGDKTERDFSWSFFTDRPRVLSVNPSSDSTFAGPTTPISVTFNHDMDLEQAKKTLHLFVFKPGDSSMPSLPPSALSPTPSYQPMQLPSGSATAVKDSISSSAMSASELYPNAKKVGITSFTFGTLMVDGKKITDRKTIVMKPSRLEFDTHYIIGVDADTRGIVGKHGTAETFVSAFSTVGDFEVRTGYVNYNALNVVFSSPVELQEDVRGNRTSTAVLKHLHITPVVDIKENIQFSTWEEIERAGTSFTVNFGEKLKPNTTYTVTLTEGLQDRYGRTLKKPWKYSFTTPEVPPAAFLHPEGRSFSIFERSKPPVYFLNQVNVSSKDVVVGRIPLKELKNFMKANVNNWQSMQDIDILATGTDVREWHLKPTSKKNEWDSVAFDIEKEYGKLAPGIYAIRYSAPEWRDYEKRPRYDTRVFAVTGMAITLKYSGSKALVWVTNLQSGEPVSGANITIHALSSDTALKGTTDKNGFFETAFAIADLKNSDYEYQPEFLVTAEKGDDIAFVGSNWNSGFGAYDFGLSSDFRSPGSAPIRLSSTVYTERPLYRAGDTVHFKGIVRFLDWNGKYAVPETAKRSVNVVIRDATSTEIYRRDLKLSPFGTFNDSLALSKEAALGHYQIEARITPDQDVSGNLYSGFSVLAYRKPEYKISLTPDREEYFTGEDVRVGIDGQYYFGAPMGNASVRWRANSIDYHFNKYTDDWYSFSASESLCWYYCASERAAFTEGKGTLDAKGRFTISFPSDLAGKKLSQMMSIEADITDQNNQVVSGQASVIVHKSSKYVGVRSDEYAVASGKPATLRLVTVTTDGLPAKNTPVEVRLFGRTWNTTRQKGVDGEYYYDNKAEDTLLSTKNTATGDDGKATLPMMLDKGGEYRVVASVRDAHGRVAEAGWTLYAWESTYFNWPHTNSDRIEIIADKPEYKVGDTAKLLVKSPYQGKGVKALVTVERENVISKRVVDVTTNALPIDVPITEDLLPTAYVSVVVMKPRIGETFNDHGLDTGAPAFKIGYVKLSIDTTPKKLSLKIITDKKRYLPRDKVNVRIEAVDAMGNPVQGEFSLGVVDMSLLDLAGFSIPDLVSHFYSERGLGVVTSNMLTYLMERFKPGSKGGGGGEGDAGVARGNFLDTAYWKAQIVTDKNGIATTSFTLPDNLTTWHLLAMGGTKDSKFGSVASTIIETKNVIVRSVRPRFGVRGDEVQFGAIVHNYLEKEQSFTVTLAGKGFKPLGSMKQTVSVKPDDRTKVLFPIKIEDGTGATFTLSAMTDGAKDVIAESIPVYEYGVNQANATFGDTEDQLTETVNVPSKKDAPRGSLTVSTSPSLAIYLPKSLSFLDTYPYECAEQTMSKIIPNLALKQLKGFEQFRTMGDKDLERKIPAMIQSIYKFQRSDGGFGYWESSERSYPYLTAYMLSGFKIARDTGYNIDQSVVDRALQYLRFSMNTKDESRESQAFMLFVLSEYGHSDVAMLSKLYGNRLDLPLYSLSYLAMAAENMKEHGKAKDLIKQLENAVRIGPRGAHFEEPSKNTYYEAMNTDQTTTALVLRAMLRIDKDNALIPKIIRGMLESRHDGHWDTTQSTAQSILSLVTYLKQSQELDFNYTASVQVGEKKVDQPFTDGKLIKRDIETALAELGQGKDIQVKLGKTGKGKLYYDLLLSYFYTPDEIAPAEEGIGILRETTPLSKEDATMKVGSTLKVRLTITVPETRHFVAVESMLPGGFEPIDLQYATSQRQLLDNVANATEHGHSWWDYYRNQVWRFGHIEYRDDRIFLFAEELPTGVYRYEYLVRATTPGKFRERPARVFEMYSPENFGQTRGGWLKIGE